MGGGSLFGLIMLIGSIVLYALGRVKPEIRRDSDIIYVGVGIVYAITTIISVSMTVIPPGIVEFQNLLAVGCIISLMWQNIRDRQPQMQGREGGLGREGTFDNLRQRFSGDSRRRPPEPPRNPGRPDNSVYRYEASLDDYDRFNEPRPNQRRIQGSEPPRGRGYDDRYDESARRGPAVDPSGRPRNPGFDDRGRGGRDDFGGRPPDDRPASRPAERTPRRNDWEEDSSYVDGRSTPAAKEGFGPERNARRSRPARPRDERSMEGRPLSRPLDDEGRPPLGGPMGSPNPSGSNPSGPNPSGPNPIGSNPTGSNPIGPTPNGPNLNAPAMDRPPLDMPPRRRPRAPGPQERSAPGAPPGAPMGGGYRDRPERGGDRPSERPNRRPPGADRPVIDATPAANRPLTPQPGAPMPPLDAPVKDDYVDFKPVTPPPENERDNSDQFDD